jgi:hypothetical protein
MTKDEAIAKIEQLYPEGEQLFVVVIPKETMEMYYEGSVTLSDNRWSAFVKNADYYGHIHEKLEEQVANELDEFVYEAEDGVE